MIDYFFYRFGHGRYSTMALLNKGIPLTVENLTQFRNVKVGDLVFFHTRDSFVSWLVMYCISSVWSHCLMYAGEGYLFHATSGGMRKDRLADLCSENTFVTVFANSEITDTQRKNLIELAAKQIGIPYNWRGVFRKCMRILFGCDYRYQVRFSVDIKAIPKSFHFPESICFLHKSNISFL